MIHEHIGHWDQLRSAPATVTGWCARFLARGSSKLQSTGHSIPVPVDPESHSGPATTLPAPVIGRKSLLGRLPAVFFLPLLAASISCSSSWKVLTSANAWAHHAARLQEECAVSTPACDCRYAALERWRRLLDEANAAVQRGGRYPLQLEALKGQEAAHGECE